MHFSRPCLFSVGWTHNPIWISLCSFLELVHHSGTYVSGDGGIIEIAMAEGCEECNEARYRIEWTSYLQSFGEMKDY